MNEKTFIKDKQGKTEEGAYVEAEGYYDGKTFKACKAVVRREINQGKVQ